MSSREELLRFLNAINSLPDGLVIVDRDNKIEYFNKAAESITGLVSNQVLGLNRSAVFENLLNVTECEPDKMLCFADEEAREYKIKRTTGSVVHLLSSISTIKDVTGGVIGALELLRDVTDQKILRDHFRLSENRYRRLFEGSKDMIFITSKNGAIREVNRACLDLLGYAGKEDLQSIHIEHIYDNPVHWKVFKKQIDLHGFVKDFESNFRKKDGTRLHCLLSGNAVIDEEGEILGYEGIAKDITARMDAIRNFRQRHLEMRILNSVALAMNKTDNLDVILKTALRKVLEALNLSCGAIFLIETDAKGTMFSMRAQQELGQDVCDILPEIEFRDEALKKALLSKDLFLQPEPIFPPFRVFKNTGPDQGVEMTCFLITAKEKASGFMAFVVPPDRDITTGQEFHLLGSVANFLGGAIQNASLIQADRQHKEELRDLTAKLYKTLDMERKRIAQDLHDETGQSLTDIRLTLEALEKDLSPDQSDVLKTIEEVKGKMNRIHEEIRRISYRLHPALLSELGLVPALEAYFSEISRKSDLKIAYSITGFEKRIDSEIETTLYRISQEALNNALTHSKAKNFRLSIIKSYPNIIFVAQDDGIGMNPDLLASKKQTLGLVGMRERVHMLNGRFFISYSKGAGAKIRAEIPFKESNGKRETYNNSSGR